MNYLGGYLPAGLAFAEAGNSHWVDFKYTATNSSGFTALPNGDIGLAGSTNTTLFMDLHNSATFWSSTPQGSYAVATTIENYLCGLTPNIVFDNKAGFGLRLLK
ncbi:MAG: hypothetical protein Q7U47_07780 [Paludibacter sp.]|nr:hypothetical protein [Paludibacter sp.]